MKDYKNNDKSNNWQHHHKKEEQRPQPAPQTNQDQKGSTAPQNWPKKKDR